MGFDAWLLVLLFLAHHHVNDAKIFNMVAIGKKPTEEPYRQFRFEHGEQRCFSFCAYSEPCVTLLFNETGYEITCLFYNRVAELMNLVDVSSPSTSAKNESLILHSVVQRYRSCLEWYTLAGAREDGKYMIVNWKKQLVEVQCKMEFTSCIDAYSLGFRVNQQYLMHESDGKVEKDCQLDLLSCKGVYDIGFRENGVFKLKNVSSGESYDGHCYFDKADCGEWFDSGFRQDGVYLILLPEADTIKNLIEVRCDMTTKGGGWIVMQRRFDGSVDFYKEWDAYKEGFGDLEGEFWLGNEYLYQLTKSYDYEWYFKATTFNGEVGTSHYRNFKVESEAFHFAMEAIKESGFDALSLGYGFSTPLRDNDERLPVNCASKARGGGFWYGACGGFYPNGEYKHQEETTYQTGIYWYTFKGYEKSMKKTLMLIRKEQGSLLDNLFHK